MQNTVFPQVHGIFVPHLFVHIKWCIPKSFWSLIRHTCGFSLVYASHWHNTYTLGNRSKKNDFHLKYILSEKTDLHKYAIWAQALAIGVAFNCGHTQALLLMLPPGQQVPWKLGSSNLKMSLEWRSNDRQMDGRCRAGMTKWQTDSPNPPWLVGWGKLLKWAPLSMHYMSERENGYVNYIKIKK